jgi:hypothetical protein
VHTEEDISMIMSVYTPTCCRVSAVRPALELKLAGGGADETPMVWKPTQRAATRRQELGTLLLAGHSMPALRLLSNVQF